MELIIFSDYPHFFALVFDLCFILIICWREVFFFLLFFFPLFFLFVTFAQMGWLMSISGWKYWFCSVELEDCRVLVVIGDERERNRSEAHKDQTPSMLRVASNCQGTSCKSSLWMIFLQTHLCSKLAPLITFYNKSSCGFASGNLLASSSRKGPVCIKSLVLHKLPAVIVFTVWVNCTDYKLVWTVIVMHCISYEISIKLARGRHLTQWQKRHRFWKKIVNHVFFRPRLSDNLCSSFTQLQFGGTLSEHSQIRPVHGRTNWNSGVKLNSKHQRFGLYKELNTESFLSLVSSTDTHEFS